MQPNGKNASSYKKLRFDSKFAGLTDDQHAEIVRWCATDGYRNTVEKIRTSYGFKTTISSLQGFTRWYQRSSGQAAFQELLEFGRDQAQLEDTELRRNLFADMKRRAYTAGNFDLLLNVLKEEGKDKERELAERRVQVIEQGAMRAKEALERIKFDGGLSAETLAKIEDAARLL
jgi:hypothetical protein